MKTKLNFLWILVVGLLVFAGCESNEDPDPNNGSILPQEFGVDIPKALSQDFESSANKIRVNGRVMVDTLDGNEIYGHLNSFIWLAEGASELVEEIIAGIVIHGIDQAMVLTVESDDDGRAKNIEVLENVTFEGNPYEFQLTITDADSEGNDDGGIGIQIFWNRSPIQGVAIMKPYNIDRVENPDPNDARIRIDYSQAGERGYEAHMIVAISGLELPDPLEDPFALSAIKMFAGVNGDVVDVYGSSDHPNAILFAGNAGFNWSFVASGNDSEDIGVAEVGLPPSNLDEPSRTVLLETYSIQNVFTNEILSVWPNVDQATLDAYLFNTAAPGYFNEDGFIQGGTSPGSEFDALAARLADLAPYNPKEIRDLQLEFKD